MARRQPPRRPRPKRHRPPDRDRREDHDKDDRKRRAHREPPEPGAGTTTTVSDDQVAAESNPATAGSPDMTSASTTAPVPADMTQQASDDLEAFFGEGHGPAMHYDLRQQQAQAETTTTAGGT